ncbi:MAG TPA: hypothetical protein VGO47_05590 [Chlamydiales bacterium]|nr:hypothetical protein [Chlamydiales bacterium]
MTTIVSEYDKPPKDFLAYSRKRALNNCTKKLPLDFRHVLPQVCRHWEHVAVQTRDLWTTTH